MIDINKLHTTPMGEERIKRNLGLETNDVISWCQQAVRSSQQIIRRGKNWYVYGTDYLLTINAHSNTIITAHKKHTPDL